MKIRRIAIIFDNTARPETTGTHVKQALDELVVRGELDEVVHFLPGDLERPAARPFDLYLVIDDGRGFAPPDHCRPAAYWTIDTHLGFEERLEMARRCDFVFAAQKRGARELTERGISSARWLPLAANPALHRKHDVPKRYDFVFVGNLFPGPRSEIVELARQYHRNSFVGRAYFDDMARTLSEAKVGLNPSVGDDVNMRFFEVPACGTLLLANALPDSGQAELLQPGRHFETYASGAEMLDKLKFYLARDDLRERIAAAGQAEVLARHTYGHRIAELLEAVIGHSSLVTGNGHIAPGAPVAEFAGIPAAGAAPTPRTLASPATSDVGGRERRKKEPGVRSQESEGNGRTSAEPETPSAERNGNKRSSVENQRSQEPGVRSQERSGAATQRRGASATEITASPCHPISASSAPPARPPHSSFILHPSSFAYYAFSRPELLMHVPSWVRRALDVGCGAGAWGASLKERQPCHLTGLELCPEAAEAARRVLDEVHLADVETFDPPWTDGAFDLVNFGDSLEHLRDPQRVLELARNWLAEGGLVVASIPNVMHHSVSASLLAGNWSYEPSGLLDQTHVRFFTRREVEKLFHRAGYDVLKLEPVYAPGADVVRGASPPGEVRAGRLRLAGLTEGEADEFFAYQYVVKATPARRPRRELTSIVFVCFNALDYTRQFLESVRFHTDGRPEFGTPYELIAVDNASSDGTRQFLESERDIVLIANAENRGFPAAANQGFRASRGRQVLFINNDVLVTTGWLSRMLDALEEREDAERGDTERGDANHRVSTSPLSASIPFAPIGLVGPCSNQVSGPQQVTPGYANLAELDGWAWEFGKLNRRRREQVDRLVGFCLLARRELLDEIGGFDERFGIGNFEDDDFCRRALAANWRAVIARDAYIHHFGHRSFAAAGIDLNALLERNRRLYDEKWQGTSQRSQETGVRSQERSGAATQSHGAPATEITASPRHPISASSSLPSSHDLLIPSPCPPHASFCNLSPVPCTLSCCMIVRNNEKTIAAAVKSIMRWVGEVIVVDTGSTDRTVEICRALGCRVYHFPWCDSFSAARNESLKYARGYWIFWMDSDDTIDDVNGRKLAELPKHVAPHIMGLVMQVHCPGPGGDLRNATVVDHCKMFRNRPGVGFEGRIHEQVLPSIRREGGEVAMTDVFVVHSGADHTPEGRRGKLARDMRLLRLELRERPGHPFTLFNLGMTYADEGKHRLAVKRLRQALAASDPRETPVRKIYALLANSLRELGRRDEACDVCRDGLSRFPKDPELWFREGVLAQDMGRWRDAERAYLAALANDDATHFASIDRGIIGYKSRHNLAVVYTALGDTAAAERQWRLAVNDAPEHLDGWHGLSRSLLAQNKLAEAEPALRELLCIDPTDASSHHNLGAVLLQLGRCEEAVRSLRTASRLRPGVEATEALLAQAREMLGVVSGEW